MANPREVIIISDDALVRYLRQLATLLGDPALGYRGATAQALLRNLAFAIGSGEEAHGAQLHDVTAQVGLLVSRVQAVPDANSETGSRPVMIEPHKDEWYALRDLANAIHTLPVGE